MIQDVLIKLRRQYGKDELVLHLLKVNSELNIELGKLKSEVLYLENELKVNKEVRVEKRKDLLYKDLFKKYQDVNKQLKNIKKERDYLMSKSINL
jgi:predicted RNase H-like nuclease (RuvC/YqgF family)